jgi:putative transposase
MISTQKVVRPKARREEALYLHQKYSVAKARVVRLLGLSVSTIEYKARPRRDEHVRAKLIELADENKRFGHPRLFVLLRANLGVVNHKRSRRAYRDLGLQIGRRKRKKLASHPRLPATRATQSMDVWAIDFMFDYIASGRRLKFFTVVGEHSKISPSCRPGRLRPAAEGSWDSGLRVAC